MDEKQTLGAMPTRRPTRSLRRRGLQPVVSTLLVAAFIYIVWLWRTPFADTIRILPISNPLVSTSSLVPLEAHIISKCPDTRVRARVSTAGYPPLADPFCFPLGCFSAAHPACHAAGVRQGRL